MKKILSLVLALMLLALCSAMAETVVETQTLTSPKGDYSYVVPADYFLMDAGVMKTLFTTPEMQQLLAQAMGLEDASQLSVYFEALETNNMMIVYGPDFASNLNVQTTAATLTMDQLVMLKAMMDAAMVQQYVSMGVAEESIQAMEIQQIGSYRWYGMQLVLADIPMQTMITIVDGTQYTVTFTMIDAEAMQGVLESFQVAAIAE